MKLKHKKGSLTHHLSKDYDWVIRWAGGANAGHTIYRDGVKYVHNLLPSFDWRYPRPKAFLGSGMVICSEQLHKEVKTLYNINSNLPSRVYVDPDAFCVLPEHKEEDKATNSHIGSTNRGIGPAYKAKINRSGSRIADIINAKNNPLNYLINQMVNMGVKFKHVLEIKKEFKNSNLLFEGAQGVMLDINHGTYPYVSCSDCTIAGIYAAGFNFVKFDRVYGVAKCYTTRVGEGPFPTELFGEEAENLRKLGNEYGATTGRPRRVGWIDLPALDYACQKGGITHLVLTKFDVLNGMDKIKMCISYDKTPVAPADFFHTKTQYLEVNGWENASDSNQLSDFIEKVEDFTDVPVEMISVGIKPGDIKNW